MKHFFGKIIFLSLASLLFFLPTTVLANHCCTSGESSELCTYVSHRSEYNPANCGTYIPPGSPCEELACPSEATPVSGAPAKEEERAGFGASQKTFEDTGEAAYGSKETVKTLGTVEERVATIINALFSLLGIAFLLLTSYGGLIWINARGDEAQAEKAKNIITRAVFGLMIIAAAYAFTAFIFRFLNR